MGGRVLNLNYKYLPVKHVIKQMFTETSNFIKMTLPNIAFEKYFINSFSFEEIWMIVKKKSCE